MPYIVALVLPTSTAYGRMVLRGVAKFARSRERWILEVVPDWVSQPERVRRWRGHGFIAHASTASLADALRATKRPFVNVADARDDVPGPSVVSDNRAIGRIAAEHFLSRGFSNLAFFGETDSHYARLRGEGFRSRAEEACCRCAWYQRKSGESQDNHWGEQVVQWVSRLPKPLGLLACNDEIGRLVMRRCTAGKIRVPEDLAVVGVDNDDMICELSDVPMSSVAVDGERIGYLAARELSRLLVGKPVSSGPLLVPPVEVVARQSTDVLAVGDSLVATAMQYIREHVAERPSVNDVAERMPVGRRTLEKRFRMAIGRSILHEIQLARIEAAKDLLLKTDLQMSTVAKRAGFLDPRQMWLIFREQLGRSPSQFRGERRLQ